MGFSLNKVMLIGNLGRDAETRFTQNNVGVTNYSIATSHSYKGKDDNWVEQTTWHNIVSFNLSDYYRDRLKKGTKIFVEGRINKRQYEKDGAQIGIVEIVSEKIIILNGEANHRESGDSPQSTEQTNDIEEDDLPF